MGRKFNDVTGKTINGFFVIEMAQFAKNGFTKWLIECNLCSRRFLKRSTDIKNNGCLYCKNRKFKNLFFQTFSKLTVISYDQKTSHEKGRDYWFCYCECGSMEFPSILGDHLLSNNTVSCGCHSRENTSNRHLTKRLQYVGKTINNFKIIGVSEKISFSDGKNKYLHVIVICPLCKENREMYKCVLNRNKSCGCQNNGGRKSVDKMKKTRKEKQEFMDLLLGRTS